MKPHKVSDLLDALYKATNPAYSPGRQKEEWMAAIHAAGIRPEHGNRGQEQESMFLVSVRPGELLIRVQRPEGYEDVHPDLVVSDMGIKEAFPVEVVVDLPVAPGSYEPQ